MVKNSETLEGRVRNKRTETRVTRNLSEAQRFDQHQRYRAGYYVSKLAIRIVCGEAEPVGPLTWEAAWERLKHIGGAKLFGRCTRGTRTS